MGAAVNIIKQCVKALSTYTEGSYFSVGSQPEWRIHYGEEIVSRFAARDERNAALQEMNMKAALAEFAELVCKPDMVRKIAEKAGPGLEYDDAQIVKTVLAVLFRVTGVEPSDA
jgi:hypothetical protein